MSLISTVSEPGSPGFAAVGSISPVLQHGGIFDEYQTGTGLDAHSQFADPRFLNPATGDFRLALDSPARTLRPDAGAVGAEMLWGD